MNTVADMIARREYRQSSRVEVRTYLVNRFGRTVREAGGAVREFERRYADRIRVIGGSFVWTGSRWIRLEE